MKIDQGLLKSEIEYAERISQNYPEKREQVFVAVLVASLVGGQLSGRNREGDSPAARNMGVTALGRTFTASELFARRSFKD